MCCRQASDADTDVVLLHDDDVADVIAVLREQSTDGELTTPLEEMSPERLRAAYLLAAERRT